MLQAHFQDWMEGSPSGLDDIQEWIEGFPYGHREYLKDNWWERLK